MHPFEIRLNRRVEKVVIAMAVAAIALWVGWRIYRAVKIEEYRRDLAAKGFPIEREWITVKNADGTESRVKKYAEKNEEVLE